MSVTMEEKEGNALGQVAPHTRVLPLSPIGKKND